MLIRRKNIALSFEFQKQTFYFQSASHIFPDFCIAMTSNATVSNGERSIDDYLGFRFSCTSMNEIS